MAKTKTPKTSPNATPQANTSFAPDANTLTDHWGRPMNGTVKNGYLNNQPGHDPSTILSPSGDLPNMGGGKGLDTIVQPQVKDRWLNLIRRQYTAENVRSTLEATNIGAPLFHQQAMFELMEESWPRVGKNLHDIRSDVSRSEWIVAPYAQKGEKPTDSAQVKAKFVEELIWGMKGNPVISQNDFTETVYDILDAYGKGVSVLEIDWDPGRPKGVYQPLGTRWIRPNYYNQATDPSELDRLKLSPSGNPLVDLQDFPMNKFITGLYRMRSNPHCGKISLLRALAPWWVFTNFATEWLLQLGQIFGMPIRWANYTSRQDLATVSKMLENMGAVSWGAFPIGTTITLKESSQATGNNPNAYILEYSDTLADLMILGQTLTSDVQKKTGSRALGEVHERILTGRKKHVAMWAGSVLTNQLATPIIRLNYGNTDEVPFIIPSFQAHSDPNLMAARDKILFMDMGLPVSLQYIYEEHGIPAPEKDDELYVAPVAPTPGGGGLGGIKAGAKPKNRANESAFKKGSKKPNRPAGVNKNAVGRLPAKATPGTPRAKSFAALETIEDGIADGVIEALEAITDDAEAILWADTIVKAAAYQGPHYRKGQPGGGWFMSQKVKDAITSVNATMTKWPPEGQHRSARYIKAFGMPDNEAEFRAYMTPGMSDLVDIRARNIKKTEPVDIATLKTTQNRIDGEKVMGMLMSTADDSTQPLARTPIVIKRGNKKWLWDGHHRAAKALMLKQNSFNARVVDMETID